MSDFRIAVIGVGATGAVLAAALLSRDPQTMLVARRPGLIDKIRQSGITISGELNYHVPARNLFEKISDIKDRDPNLIFVATKTFDLPEVIEALKAVFTPGIKIVSTHNGLGTEDVITEAFGADAALRMSLNFGAFLKGQFEAATTFFNRPNHLGGLVPENKKVGLKIAGLFTASGLETEYVDDIKFYVWKKMIMKCTMASICAVTDKTIRDALGFSPTREIADACFREALAVARAKGYDLGDDYLTHAMAYLEKVGIHKDSMCVDIANRTRTEIDFLGAKVVEYGKETGIPTPYYETMTNLVKAIEDNYLRQLQSPT